jgi:hypothetical protein
MGLGDSRVLANCAIIFSALIGPDRYPGHFLKTVLISKLHLFLKPNKYALAMVFEGDTVFMF